MCTSDTGELILPSQLACFIPGFLEDAMSLMRKFEYKYIVFASVGVLLVVNSFAFTGQKKSVLNKSSKKSASFPVQKENRIEVVKFNPGDDICVSVEGAHIDRGQELNDAFSSCARKLYKKKLTNLQVPKGTQSNAEAARLLKACLKHRPGNKTLLIGHGQPGAILTGNGQVFPGGKDQAVVAGDSESAAAFEDLNSQELTLFGCWVGATPEDTAPDDLVNELASKSRRVQAQNSVVFCSVEKGRRGLYLDASPARVWVKDTLLGVRATQPFPLLLKDIAKPACICLKDQDDMCGESVDLKRNVDKATFPWDDVRLTDYTPPSEFANPSSLLGRKLLPDFQRELLKFNTENLVDTIGFCSPGQPGIPDLVVVGNFVLTIHGKPRQFDVLGTVMPEDKNPILDVMVQDHDHPEELYWMRGRAFQQFHESFQQQLEILQQKMMLKSPGKARGKTPNN
jgi:hypothetical protein